MKGIAVSKFLILFGAQGMHQVEVEIAGPCNLQLAFKKGADLCFRLKKGAAQLIRQQIAVSGIPFHQTLPQCGLAVTGDVTVRGVKIAKTLGKKCVHHLTDLLRIHSAFAAHRTGGHGKPHASEAQLLGAKIQRFHVFPPVSVQIIGVPYGPCYKAFPCLSRALQPLDVPYSMILEGDETFLNFCLCSRPFIDILASK